MEALMQGLYQFSANNTDVSSLKFVRVAQEELSDNLWRWLCVFEKLPYLWISEIRYSWSFFSRSTLKLLRQKRFFNRLSQHQFPS